MTFSTKFNTLKELFKQQTSFVEGESTHQVKDFNEYIELTRQAAVEQVGGSLSLYFNIEILLLLDRYAKFFAGEFTEKKNEEFSEIEELFLTSLWRHGKIYVSYSEKLLELELVLRKRYDGITKWDVLPDCKWRIYKIQKTDSGIRYTSLISGITDIKIDDEELIEVRWDNSYTWRFLSWWKLAVCMNEAEQMFFELIKVSTKRVATKAHDSKLSQAIRKALLNGSTILSSEGSGTTYYNAVEFAKIPELSIFYDTFIQWFYFNAGQLGYTGNASDKTERMTTGEHVKDLKPVVNNQKCVLKNLNNFARKAKEKWSQEIQFVATSTQSMDGSNIQISDAQTPNGPLNNKKVE